MLAADVSLFGGIGKVAEVVGVAHPNDMADCAMRAVSAYRVPEVAVAREVLGNPLGDGLAALVEGVAVKFHIDTFFLVVETSTASIVQDSEDRKTGASCKKRKPSCLEDDLLGGDVSAPYLRSCGWFRFRCVLCVPDGWPSCLRGISGEQRLLLYDVSCRHFRERT